MSDQTETMIFIGDKNNENSREETEKCVIYSIDDNVEIGGAKGSLRRSKEIYGNVSADTKPPVKYTYKRSTPSSTSIPPTKGDHSYSDTHVSPGKAPPQIKTLNDLRKITPKVRLFAPEVKSLNELSKLAPTPKDRHQLKNYCRTCAGLKIPLVDIFGEKGLQMRLNQQMKHLEEIDQHDGLSTQMCMDCICDLKMSYKFFMQIKKAQVKLRSLAGTSWNEDKSRVATIPDSPKKKTPIEPVKLVETIKVVSAPVQVRKDTPVLALKESTVQVKKNSPIQALKDSANQTRKDSSDQKQKNSPEQVRNESPAQIHKEAPGRISEDITVQLHKEAIVQEPKEQGVEVSIDLPRAESIDLPVDTSIELSIEVPDDPPSSPDPPALPSPAPTSDNESIEEFDPEDSVMDNDSLEPPGESPEEPKAPENPSDSSSGPAKPEKKSEAVYQFDTALNTYIKVNPHSHPATDMEELKDQPKQGEKTNEEGGKNSPRKVLKRKASLGKDSLDSQSMSETETPKKSLKEPKLQKLMGNPLNVSPAGEEGVMYVTVKGPKPNELLLVKVKKMDKNGDKKDEHRPIILKKPFDGKPLKTVEKLLRAMPFKATESSDQSESSKIIEQQIEQYKKKREQILGGRASLPNALKVEDGTVRFVNPVQSLSETEEGKHEIGNGEAKEKIKFRTYSSTETDENRPVSTKEYLAKFARLKRRWEEAKAKKAALQEQLNASYTEGNLEKLTRILGEREKNLQDFQEYLRQRKIVITKLKDEDIISLYEGRSMTDANKKFFDFTNEDTSAEGLMEVDLFDCDYCTQTFLSSDTLEDHLKTHDYKIHYFCEDCGEESYTNKSKRSHNVTCIKKLICKYCDLMLESRGKKRQHEQKHCDAIYGQLCDICGEKFKHQGTLDQHIKTQHMSWEKIFECPKCDKKFAFKQKLSFHLKSVHTTMRAYLCEDCGADFKNPASLRHHRIRKHQPTGNKRDCPVCHKMVPFYSLSKHMYTHKAYTMQCPHCDKMFKNTSTLKQHVRIHEDQRQYRCDTCGVGFNRRDGLRLHLRVHQKTDSRALKECSCQICSEKFPNHSMLVIHRNRVHKDGKQYTCQICNRSMLSTRSLEWHMSHIHNQTTPGASKDDGDKVGDKKRVTCNHCLKTFKTEMILRTHIKNTHMEKNPVKCLDCVETFTSEVRLRHHMMVTHNRLEGTLTCPHCPKRFVNQLRLKTHMISHSEDRPFTCEICGFNLKTKIQLIKHHQNRHSDERPLQCRYCPWRCKQVSALVCHERTHTNERPYSCIVCKQRFKYLGDKNKHERRHESLGGSGFKRIVSGRNVKKGDGEPDGEEDTSEEQEIELEMDQEQFEIEGELGEEEEFEEGEEFDTEDQIVKFEAQEIEGQYGQEYQQEYEETSREDSEAAEVIMSMEDATVYTEEVTAENIEGAEMITDEIMTSQILQAGTVVHIQQQDDDGKIQVIPVMLSLPDLSEAGAEVNLATASIMYNNG
ncbi:uncharacterized protein LOC135165267 [Diachasmimorpha longicaudata]|uniref:uncharacterized protein LOC135165267 n=1 Tax=Diachasmimorpha longicaudata TaxID=58733 RepID=UPI0030B8A3F3